MYIRRGIAVTLLLACEIAEGSGVGVTKGTEPGLWNAWSVIYATVTSTESINDRSDLVTLDVKATLAGLLDPSALPKLRAELDRGRLATIREAPRRGDRVIVVVSPRENARYVISPRQLLFTPNGRGLVVVRGFDDPLVDQTITLLRIVRELKDDRVTRIQQQIKERLDAMEEKEHGKAGVPPATIPDTMKQPGSPRKARSGATGVAPVH
jgi:hypothetical protein